MAVRAGGAYIDIEAKLDSFKKDLDKQVVKASSTAADNAGKKITSTFRKVGATIGGLFVIDKAVDFVGDAIANAREAGEVTRATEQVIKTTGAAANVSADEVARLADKISLATGVDDELVQSGENLLLTFTKVRNEVGRGNDIFDRATQTALDMSTVFGGDVKKSAIQLGKALNDPIKGVSALTRVGVTFTQKQKDTIAALVETGDVLGAQKLILVELETQVGGQAEAQADAAAKAGVAWENAKETLGNVLLPVVEKLSTWFAEKLPIAIEFLRQKFEDWKPTLVTIGRVLEAIGRFIIDHKEAFIQGAIAIGLMVAAWKLYKLAVAAATVAQIALNIAMSLNPIALVVIAIAALVAALVVAYFKIQGFRDLVDQAWQKIQTVVRTAMAIIQTAISIGLDLISGRWGDAWDKIKNVASDAIDAVVGFVADLGPKILSFLGTVGSAALALGSAILNGIVRGVSAAAGVIGDIASAIGNAIKNFINVNVIDRINSALEFTLDLGFVGSITIDAPDIPRLHSGGVFRSPFGQTEGLALLRDGEEVLTPEQRARGGRGGVTFNQYYPTDPDLQLAALRRHEVLYA